MMWTRRRERSSPWLATGADIVKVGLSARSGAVRTLERLGKLELGEVLLVGVLLADQGVDLDLVGTRA